MRGSAADLSTGTSTASFRDKVLAWAGTRFDGLQVLKETATCRLHYFECDGSPFVIKDFYYKDLFDVELSAFVGLAQSNRTCELVFDSTQLPTYWNESFPGPYFLVKPYFSNLVHYEPNIFYLLDIAAQEVDISRQLLGKGWRDLDGDLSNDAIDPNCRVVRFDLDGAQPNWARIRKFNPRYHGNEASDDRNKIRQLYDDLLSEDAEMVSLAVRISRFFLKASGAWPLLDRIQRIEANERQNEPGKRARSRRWLKSRFGWAKGRTSGIAVGKEETIRTEWLRFWENNLAIDSVVGLSKSENRFLGDVTFNILAKREPKLAYMRDLYLSLLLLILVCLERYQKTCKPEDFQRLLRELPELSPFITELEGDGRKAASSLIVRRTVRESQNELKPRRFAVCQYDGKSWTATQKERSWQCQDLVIRLNTAPCVFALADGATRGSGARAIEIVEQVGKTFAEKFAVGSAAQMQHVLADLARTIHQELVRKGLEHGSQWETTLVLAGLFADEDPPTLLVGRWGNSNYILTLQDESNEGKPYKPASFRDRDSTSLGAWNREDPKTQDVKTLSLTNTGKYRIRVFSDGVKESVHQELLSDKSITRLINEAYKWPERDSQIGVDDWALGGLDVDVTWQAAAELSTSGRALESPVVDQSQIRITNVANNKFNFSKSAIEFWKRVISSDPELYSLGESSIVEKVIGTIGLPGSSMPSNHRLEPISRVEKQGVVTERFQREPRLKEWWNRVGLAWTAIAVLFVVIGGGLFWYLLWPGGDRTGSNQSRSQVGSATPGQAGAQKKEVLLTREQQRKIFNSLQSSAGTYELRRLPKGWTVQNENFSEFIQDLAAVVSQTDWTIDVEVHTDGSGPMDKLQRQRLNMQTSRRRAQALATLFARQAPNLVDRVRFVAKGDAEPRVPNETSEEEMAQNRRLLVKRTSISNQE